MGDFDLGDLTGEQIEKVLQFQDLTGNEDLAVCRDVLLRHNWNLEVAVQEQLNLFEGRPSMYAQDSRLRPPTVVDEANARIYFSPEGSPNSGGFFSYLMSLCYNVVTSIFQLIFTLFRRNVRPVSLDPVQDVVNFIRSYEEQFGTNHPVFYQGSYSQALSDAKQELRFLLVYLHKDESQEVDQWCRNTLGDPEVIRFINTNTLFWACNIKSGEGYKVAEALRVGTYPFLATIVLKEHKMTIVGKMVGLVQSSTMIRRMQELTEEYESSLSTERHERAQRQVNATLRQEQDDAYQLSLKADQEKERIRLQQENESKRQAERERTEKMEQEAMLERIRLHKEECLQNLLEEPPKNDPSCCHIQTCVAGQKITRRFPSTCKVQNIYEWIYGQPESPNTFRIMSFNFKEIYPNFKDLTLLDAGLTGRVFVHVQNDEEEDEEEEEN
ncbi:FAS-associated factor 2 [Trichogramma pretiosum]|uniref:FAS-associated factor 2 n=1 Tax=Trichogramma pretiosum TaxID=7493 RepID=UPI0006C99741|nr:FAS-associated factor 2 [Trichogramma pretiosum]